jgi:hypothetical protein
VIRRAAVILAVTMVAAACGPSREEVPVVVGPDLPGADIITSDGEITTSDDETSEVAVTTQVRFGPVFVTTKPDGPGRVGILLAEVVLGPLLVSVRSSPDVTTTISNSSNEEVGGVLLESSFAIAGETRDDVVISADPDVGTCSVSGATATVSCLVGAIAAEGRRATVIDVREAALLEGIVTVTTRVRADVAAGEPTVGPTGPSPPS